MNANIIKTFTSNRLLGHGRLEDRTSYRSWKRHCVEGEQASTPTL
jgi:hypothetical protein